jgi:hypothetical protein
VKSIITIFLVAFLLGSKVFAQTTKTPSSSPLLNIQMDADSIQRELLSKTDSLLPKNTNVAAPDLSNRAVEKSVAFQDSIQGQLSKRADSGKAVVDEKFSKLDSLAKLEIASPAPEISSPIKVPDNEVGLGEHIPEIDNLEDNIIPETKELMPSEISVGEGEVGDVSKEIADLNEKVGTINQGDLNQVTEAPALAEDKLMQTDQLSGFKEASESTTAVKEQFKESLNAPTELPALGQRRPLKVMVDHFVDKPEVINQGMEELNKLQKKYGDVPDSRYLPKRRKNPEREKPFIERMIFGNAFEVQQVSPKWTGVRTWPHVGFKFSDRFRSSIGFTYEFDLAPRQIEYRKVDSPFGFRASAAYKLVGTNFVVVEGGTFDSELRGNQPPIHTKPESHDLSRYIKLGVLRNMKITKRLDWTVQYLLSAEEIKNFTFQGSEFRCGVQYCFVKKSDKEK